MHIYVHFIFFHAFREGIQVSITEGGERPLLWEIGYDTILLLAVITEAAGVGEARDFCYLLQLQAAAGIWDGGGGGGGGGKQHNYFLYVQVMEPKSWIK